MTSLLRTGDWSWDDGGSMRQFAKWAVLAAVIFFLGFASGEVYIKHLYATCETDTECEGIDGWEVRQ